MRWWAIVAVCAVVVLAFGAGFYAGTLQLPGEVDNAIAHAAQAEARASARDAALRVCEDGWEAQLAVMRATEPTGPVTTGVYLARISWAESGTANLVADWEGFDDTGVSNRSPYIQHLEFSPEAVVFAQQTDARAGGEYFRYVPKPQSTRAFFAGLNQRSRQPNPAASNHWWVAVEDGICFGLTEAPRF